MDLLAIILIIVGLLITFVRVRNVKKYDVIPGSVVEIITDTYCEGSTFRPRISYSDMYNVEHYYEPNSSSDPCPYKIGDRLNLLFDYKKGVVKGILSAYSLFLFPYILIGAGVLILGSKMLLVFESTIFSSLR